MKEKKVILIVDDNRLNIVLLSNILKKEGYDILEAANGQIALDIVKDKQDAISLVLLDINMPVMNGYEFLDKMNEIGLLSSVPVIVTTSNEDENAEVKCLKNGASDFIRKPYEAQIVKHRIKSLFRLVENSALLNRLEIDRLTGLYSKEFFFHYAEEILDKNPDGTFYIVYTDIDDFKMINAKYGNEVGDKLLKYFANRIKEYVDDSGICGRIGADEFAMLLCSEKEHTQEEVGKLMEQKHADAPVQGFKSRYGIYKIHSRSITISDMCDRAKIAEETVKHQYGVYYAIYNDKIRERIAREHLLTDSMEKGLKNNEFKVYIQPKFYSRKKTIMGAEALVRWNHSELGLISPGEFIPLFEKNAFIINIDLFVLEETCKFLKNRIDKGLENVPISVNISRVDFYNESLVDLIIKTVDKYQIPHELIHLEVTESAYTDNPDEIIMVINEFRKLNFKIEMDDFGSGYSSLNMISEVLVDVIKVDMHFIRKKNAIKADKRTNILSFIIKLSKWLKVPTVIEGVETEEEFRYVRDMGCDVVQGYYFSKPIPIEKFGGYLNDCLLAR